jgi:Zn-dependent protease with chaperone function
LIAVFGAFIIWAILPTDWTSFWVNIIFEKFITFTARLPYSRHLEDEADVIGLMLAAKVNKMYFENLYFKLLFQSCYDVREAVNFWQQAFKAEDQQGGPEFLSTHPSSAKRAENLREKLPWAIDIRQQCKCTPLPENKKLGELHLTKNPDEKVFNFINYF